MKQKSFFYKLFTLVVVITSLSVLVTAFVLTTSNAKVLIQRINIQAEENVRDLHKKLELQLLNMESIIEVLSLVDEVKNINVEGVELMMEEVSKISPYLFIYVTNSDGKQVYKTYGDLIDISDREYFQKAIQGEANYSEVLISRTQLYPVVIYARPIVKEGEIVGVIAGAIDVSYLSELNSNGDGNNNHQSYIVDSKGKVIIHPDEELVKTRANLSDRSYIVDVLAGKNGTGQYIVENKKKLISYMPLESLGGGVVVEIEVEAAFGAVDKMMNQAITIIVFVVFIGMLITYGMIKHMTKSLIVLKEKMALASQGNLDVDFDDVMLAGKDEFSILSRDFQRLMKKNKIVIQNIRSCSEQLNDILGGIDNNNLEIERTIVELQETHENYCEDNGFIEKTQILFELIKKERIDLEELKKVDEELSELIYYFKSKI